MHACLCTIYVQCSWKPKEGIEYPGAGGNDSCELTDAGSLKDQLVLLTVIPSFKSQIKITYLFKNWPDVAFSSIPL